MEADHTTTASEQPKNKRSRTRSAVQKQRAKERRTEPGSTEKIRGWRPDYTRFKTEASGNATEYQEFRPGTQPVRFGFDEAWSGAGFRDDIIYDDVVGEEHPWYAYVAEVPYQLYQCLRIEQRFEHWRDVIHSHLLSITFLMLAMKFSAIADTRPDFRMGWFSSLRRTELRVPEVIMRFVDQIGDLDLNGMRLEVANPAILAFRCICAAITTFHSQGKFDDVMLATRNLKLATAPDGRRILRDFNNELYSDEDLTRLELHLEDVGPRMRLQSSDGTLRFEAKWCFRFERDKYFTRQQLIDSLPQTVVRDLSRPLTLKDLSQVIRDLPDPARVNNPFREGNKLRSLIDTPTPERFQANLEEVVIGLRSFTVDLSVHTSSGHYQPHVLGSRSQFARRVRDSIDLPFEAPSSVESTFSLLQPLGARCRHRFKEPFLKIVLEELNREDKLWKHISGSVTVRGLPKVTS